MIIQVEDILKASVRLRDIAFHTALTKSYNYSKKYEANIFFKREDLQKVRSYKLRGAFNFMINQESELLKNGVVCASAGNHAQGVAYSCNKLKIKGVVFMPSTTPMQKKNQVKMFGQEFVETRLVGDTFDDAFNEATHFAEENNMLFVPPFNHLKIIEGQGTVGVEILNDMTVPLDYLFLPIGGGGLAAGVGAYIKKLSPNTKIIGVEPEGAASMYESIKSGKVVRLDKMDTFVDGAAVKQVGALNYEICKEVLDDIVLVPEGKICTTMIKLYNEEAIVVEPAGALTIAALDLYKDKIKGKNVVSVISGSNNDLDRMQEVKERSLLYEGLKHYFMVKFPQRAGALREFVNEVLGADDDISHFEYAKKSNKEAGPAVIGIELKRKEDFEGLIQRMKDKKINFTLLNDNPLLFEYLV